MSENKEMMENQEGQVQQDGAATNTQPAVVEPKVGIKEKYKLVCLTLIEKKKALADLNLKIFNDPKNADLKKTKKEIKKEIRVLTVKKNAAWIALVTVLGLAAAVFFAKQLAKESGDDEFIADVEAKEVSE